MECNSSSMSNFSGDLIFRISTHFYTQNMGDLSLSFDDLMKDWAEIRNPTTQIFLWDLDKRQKSLSMIK